MIDILYEDNSIIVIKKPAGLATQSAGITSKDCVSLIKTHLARSKNANVKDPYVGVVHRLDQPVSGILVFAKNQKAAASLSKQVQTDFMNKNYHALVEGSINKADNVELINMMYKDSKQSKAIIIDENNKAKLPANIKLQKAALSYDVESIDNDKTLLKIHLRTGRFHQIRAQLSQLGHPILGDRKYGSSKECPDDFVEGNNKNAIALVADELTFVHPDTGKKMIFKI